jgi:hypothetical protein
VRAASALCSSRACRGHSACAFSIIAAFHAAETSSISGSDLQVSVLLCSGIRIARAPSSASSNSAVSNQRVTTFDRSRESFGGCHFVRGRLGLQWRRRTRWQMSRRRQWVDRQQRMTVVVYRTTANAASTHGLVIPGIRLLAPSKTGRGDSRMF